MNFLIYGLYLIVLLYPFIDLQIIWGELNVPYVDAVALIVFIVWLFKIIKDRKIKKEYFPGFIFFILFIISAALSLINASDFWLSFKYVLRPLAFFYLMFILLPYNIINNKKVLEKVLQILYGVGIFVSILGFLSLFFVASPNLLSKRVVPFSLFGLNFLGTNHNQIAEVLVVIIPVGFLLYYFTKKELNKKFLLLGTLFMILITLLTFSRSAWIALFVELLIFLAFNYRYNLKKIFKPLAVVLLILSPLIIYIFIFSSQEIVTGSNVNRLMLIDISLEVWQDHPLIGYGAGTFQDFVAKDYFYILEFGNPLDAHGFVWKLLPEMGLFGLVSYLVLLGYVFYKLFKTYLTKIKNKVWSYYLLLFIIISVGIVVFEFFQTSYYISRLWLPLGIGLAITKLSYEQKD